MRYLVLGNWKSNGTATELADFVEEYGSQAAALPPQTAVGLALPYHLVGAAPKVGLLRGAQNVSPFGAGAYTGEIHAAMLTELGCDFCLVGHSERRQYFGETPADTGKKLEHLHEAGCLAVLCIGESLKQRQAGQLRAVLSDQLAPLRGKSWPEDLAVAYEPVWAIGTGVAASPLDVADAHTLIKSMLVEIGLGGVPLLYGGSVKPANAQSLAAIDGVDGFLIGGASLQAASFAGIVRGFTSAKTT